MRLSPSHLGVALVAVGAALALSPDAFAAYECTNNPANACVNAGTKDCTTPPGNCNRCSSTAANTFCEGPVVPSCTQTMIPGGCGTWETGSCDYTVMPVICGAWIPSSTPCARQACNGG